MDRANHKGGYGEAFVAALAAAAGLRTAKPMPDLDGVDFLIWSDRTGRFGGARGTPINVQVKSSSATTETDTHWGYRLEVPHFNVLADKECMVYPTYLFLVVVPAEPNHFATAATDGLLLRNAAYWHSLADQEQIVDAGKGSKVNVAVPKANLLTVDSLCTLVKAPLERAEAS